MTTHQLISPPAEVAGQAARIPAAQKVTPEQGVAMLAAQGGTLTAAITITRAGTGKVEHYKLGLTPADETKEP